MNGSCGGIEYILFISCDAFGGGKDVHWLRMMRHLRHWRHNHLRISRPIHLMLGMMIYHSRSHGRYRMQCIRHIECMLHFITIDKLIISDGF